ncbi:hypothetical protein [Ideonella livida]|uniref:Uncharacterized protein n=1 Tax=Ideonella livida TaxID=2707176 RepID=A0A7C9PEJ4_9BURK|nr:hypothetical protein [Ideonella livida]NDY89689.1 hypothetical protein [Ideonella livida]
MRIAIIWILSAALAVVLCGCSSLPQHAPQPPEVRPLKLPDLGLRPEQPNFRQRLSRLWTESPQTPMSSLPNEIDASQPTPMRNPP